MKANEFIREGADFMGYMKEKDPQDGSVRWTYPKGFETHTPHRSNMAARQLLGKLGLETDFENSGPMPIDDFITATDRLHDQDEEVHMYRQEALRIKKANPELTHVSFV
jgi:hypothetical protein|tara:strand:- start:106 stop:432 length:327 start_codon:yes stop_codon:yes gene_type:complete